MLPRTLPRPRVLCPARCAALLFALLALLPASAAMAFEQNTTFLPLKINAPAGADEIAARADRALSAALAEKGFAMMSREQAEKVADYHGPWPPGGPALAAIASVTGHDYVALGSLTVLGKGFSIDMSVFDLLSPDTPFSTYQSGRDMDMLGEAVTEAVGEVIGYSGRDFIIAEIAPQGNDRIDSGAILARIKTKPGDPYDPKALREDLKSIFKMGYFDNVLIEVADTPKGKAVTFRVEEKPVIAVVEISGADEIDEDDVREAAGVRPNTILNAYKLQEAVRNIKALYRSKGYYNTDVAAKLSYPGNDRVNVRIVIEEGRKLFVRKIEFVGNSAFDESDLEDVIQTSTKGFFSFITESGLLKPDVLQQDAARIAAFYHNHGYVEAKVAEPKVEQRDDALVITFSIDEGPRYRVGTVKLEGDLVEEEDNLLDLLKIRQEKFMNRKVLREDVLRLTDLYAEHGYAFADVRPKVDQPPGSRRADITFQIDKGELVYFSRVEIVGNTRTRDNVIRRELTIQEGGIFDAKAIRKSTARLQRLGYFEEVNITPEPTMEEDRMNVRVEVKEQSTGQFSIGAGYSSAENLMFMAEISENNLFGWGDQLSLAANLSSNTTRFNLNFTNPRIFDSRVSAGFDLFNWTREYDDYTKDSTGGALRLGHPLVEKWRIYYSYGYTDTKLTDVAEDASWVIRESMDIRYTSAVKVGLVRDSRNRYIFPSEGSENRISVKYAGGPLGGDAEFTKVEALTSWYFSLPWDNVFHVRGAAGQAFEHEDGGLPVYERFYQGGLNSIRGYKYGDISPIDPLTGEKIGGDKMWYANIEWIFPLVKEAGLRGVVFADFGNVYAVEEDWDFGTFKKTAGLGFRWLSPMGPLRLEWGYNLDPDEGDDTSNWDFSIGGTF